MFSGVHGTPVAAGRASGDRAGPVDFSPGILDARKMIDGGELEQSSAHRPSMPAFKAVELGISPANQFIHGSGFAVASDEASADLALNAAFARTRRNK